MFVDPGIADCRAFFGGEHVARVKRPAWRGHGQRRCCARDELTQSLRIPWQLVDAAGCRTKQSLTVRLQTPSMQRRRRHPAGTRRIRGVGRRIEIETAARPVVEDQSIVEYDARGELRK